MTTLLLVGACESGPAGSVAAPAGPSSGPGPSGPGPSGPADVPVVAEVPAVAPYIDIVSGTADVGEIHDSTGLTDFTLAFVLAADSGSCTASWGGTRALDDRSIRAEIDTIKGFGGTVTVSTGGADGSYLEEVCPAGQLAGAYATALDAAGSNHLDVDIEKAVSAGTVIAALSTLQADRGAAITLTVPVDGVETGLPEASVGLLRAARQAGLEVTVNAMIMNFDADGTWGRAMVAAAEAVHADLAAVWTDRSDQQISAMLGLTPMIGVNDTGPVTTVADARTVLAYAERTGLGFLRFWSVNRDNGGCATGRLSSTCSGIDQQDYAFTRVFAGYRR